MRSSRMLHGGAEVRALVVRDAWGAPLYSAQTWGAGCGARSPPGLGWCMVQEGGRGTDVHTSVPRARGHGGQATTPPDREGGRSRTNGGDQRRRTVWCGLFQQRHIKHGFLLF